MSPDDRLYHCLTKVTTAEGDYLRHSPNWLVSRRGWLSVYLDRLVCGDWVIPYSAVDQAILYRTRQMLIPCYVLKIRSCGRTYQFGLNPARFWSGPLPFDVERATARLKCSPTRLAMGAVLLAAVVWWIHRVWVG